MPELNITTARFNFPTLVRSHGWVWLAPFSWCEAGKKLSRPLGLPHGRKVTVAVAVGHKNAARSLVTVSVETANVPLAAEDRQAIRRQVSRMLCLNDDYRPFHQMCAKDRMLRFVSRRRCGGMLRSPTAFEDLVKTVCTTNCDWRNTKRMCETLCLLGDGCFPAPEEVLRFSAQRLATKVPVGYRSRTIHAIAKLTADGKLPVDAWAEAGDYEAVRASLGSVWGIGPYALNHMLVLLGDYSAIPVDSEVMKYLRRVHFAGRRVSEAEAVKPYHRYGKFRFLAFKFSRMARALNYVDK